MGTNAELDDEGAETPPKRNVCDEMARDGQTLIQIAEALRQLPDDETRLRVIRATAALYGIDLPRDGHGR